MKGAFKGRRCFVVGNGPSLRISDLDMIKRSGDIAIASNKIYLAFEGTNWRPTIYTVADWCVAENNIEVIKSLDILKIFPSEFIQFFADSKHGVSIFFKQFVPPERPDSEYISYFYSDLNEGAFVGETITNLNIQIATHLGCSQIYLIGVDGKYQTSESRTSNPRYKEVLVSEGEQNHFTKSYREPGETWSIPRVECHEKNYEHSYEELNNRGIELANASRQTEIKSLPRIDFDSLF